jgi:hypothetical protein
MPWPISNHESPDVDLSIPAVTAPHYLWAMLRADGEPFRPNDYAIVRGYLEEAVRAFGQRNTGGQAPNPAVSDQRLRTWKAAFEEMGLLTVDDGGAVRATRFGRAVVDGLQAVEHTLTSANRRIAQLGAQVANRVMLAKPDGRGQPPAGVPSDSDLLPLRVIWRAFRKLGDRLHWQDINRVLGHLHYDRDVESAIDRIVRFRRNHPNAYPTGRADLASLGSAPLTDDPRHITPWFNRAGIGGMLIPSEADAEGFRILPSDSVTIIDGLLGQPVPPAPAHARSDREAYISYLMEPVERAARPAIDPADAELTQNIIKEVRDFGDRRIIALSGLPGTGKSRIARIIADELTDGDALRLKDIQFHESTSYEDFIEGFVPRPDGQGFERRDKTFRIINQRALDDPNRAHVLLIEEFTRANVHSVLGELLTFIEHRGRKFTLPISQEEITVAPNLVVIVTMNPRDRSALSLDDAVSRRMHRVTVPSSPQSLRRMLTKSLSEPGLSALVTWFAEHVDVLPFGHGVFDGADSVNGLTSIWCGTVVPMLTDPLGRVHEAYKAAHDTFPFPTRPMAEMHVHIASATASNTPTILPLDDSDTQPPSNVSSSM